ncbi:MAG: type II secretion system protein GspD [Deltaproteobacteria bacterium]|nr:MAG: type II secretion system protein GspD [Deltaproteobacteria bacterium]
MTLSTDTLLMTLPTGLRRSALLLGLALATPAMAQDPRTPEGTSAPEQRGPDVRTADTAASFKLDGEFTIEALIKLMADSYRMNFILEDPKLLQEKVRIISHESVGRDEAYQAIVAALEAKGFTVVKTGSTNRIIKTSEASQNPIRTGNGDRVAYTAAYVTQIMALKNVSVSDVNSVVSSLASGDAKVIAYAPSNTLIITDSAHNIRRIKSILDELDVAAPKSEMQIIAIKHADADEVKGIIEQLYSVGEAPAANNNNQPQQTAAQRRRAARRRRNNPQPEAQTTTSVTAGKESNYISKILSDTRTNSLIVLANEEGMAAVIDVVAKLDVDVEGRQQIHVVYLQHAKAEDVAQVLSNLSESGSGQQRNTRAQTPAQRAAAQRAGNAQPAEDAGSTSVTAAFDSGMRITHDENTNSLVIIAGEEEFRIVRRVIDQLDVRRRQVFVDAVILEIASNDELEVGLGVHAPVQAGPDAVGIVASQTPLQSVFGLSQDLLSGLALGVFGEGIEVPVPAGLSPDGSGTLEIPAFGIVLNALKSNSAINIVSNPTLVTLDNEEARIEVGRKIPFPTTSGLNNLGQPVVSYQREDVALKLEVLPRINSADEVTLEITVEVSEIEEDNRGLDINTAGFITSKREVETVTLVGDNETVVLGGLVGLTDTTVETKVPVLGDLPLIGALFRGSRNESRKSDLMIFLTPHIIDGPEDMLRVREVKEAQRQEFIRRFYGKSREQQMDALRDLLGYSMNYLDEPSMYPPKPPREKVTTIGGDEDGPVDETLEAPVEDGPVDETELPADDELLPEDDGLEGGE